MTCPGIPSVADWGSALGPPAGGSREQGGAIAAGDDARLSIEE